MKPLVNHLNKGEALKRIAAEDFKRRTLSFYRYVKIENPALERDRLFGEWEKLGVMGRVYIAEEGINAQINVPVPNWEAFRAQVDSVEYLKDVPFKVAIEEPTVSFWKLAIKVKKQIVADNLPADSYDISNVGNHLTAEEFNREIENGAIVVDMRNKYESDIGRFETAITPEAQTFADELPEVLEKLADKKEEKVLLYCTGGIRCEKASAFLKHHGFKDVNQLYGGIISYKHEIEQKKLPSKFLGKNFVFDGRMAEKVTNDVLGQCFNCNQSADTYDNCPNDMCHALFIQCDDCRKIMNGACSQDCLRIVNLSEEEKRALRRGQKAVFRVY